MADWNSDFEARLAEGSAGYLEEQAFLDLIDKYLEKGLWAEALLAVCEALRQHPFSIELMCSHATALLEMDRAEDALEVLRHAAGMAPGESDVTFLQVETLIELGRAADAEILLAPFLRKGNPEDLADAWYFQSLIEEQRDAWSTMHRCLEKAVRNNTRFPEALERLWLSTEMLGNYEESILFYREIIDQDPYSWQVWYNLGHAHACTEDYAQAAEAFEYACIIEDSYEHAWRDQGEMRLQLGQTGAAIECFLAALERSEDRDAELLTRLGEAWEKQGNRDNAFACFREVIGKNPAHDEAHFRLGGLYFLEGRLEEAVFHLEAAINHQNEREEYFVALAEVYFRQGFLAQAEMCLHRALELAPEQSGYWLQYASFLLQNGSLEEALDILDSAITQQRSPQLDYARIACLFRLGKRQEACQSLCLQLAEDYHAHQTMFDLAPELSSDPDVISLVRAFRIEG